jgi:hypothetical protein
VTIFCRGCGHAVSEAEARHKLASQFANPALGCLTAQAPAHARFSGVRPGRHELVESLTVAWPSGETLTALAPAGGRLVAQAALPRLRAEQAKQRGTQPPERHGAVVTIWSKAPSPEQAATLRRCVR